MALTDGNENGMVMPVQPMMGGGWGGYSMPVTPVMGGIGGGNSWGGDWGSLIVLFLIAAMFGGFGNGGFGGGFGGNQLGYDFPWLLNGQNGINNNVSDGFRTAQLQDSVTSVRDGVSNLATQLCNCCGDIQMGLANGFAGVQQSLCSGFAGTTAAVTGAQNALAQQMYSNELASLNRSFAEQTANTQGFTSVNNGIADVRYTLATEGCATRNNDTQNTQTLLTALTAGVQSIKDQLCQDKIDAKNDEIAQLRQEVLYARGQASQDVQTARILAGQTAEVDALYNRLDQCPVGTVPVYGRQPIFTCNNNSCGCGCGNNGF